MDNLGTSERLRRALLLKTGQTTSYVTGDDGNLEIGEPHRYYVLSTGQYSGTTNITLNSKTDAHSNACVLDETTGLMWSRTLSASVGTASNGVLPWTTNGSGEGIFAYASAANSASLAGYTDWRIPTANELCTMVIHEAPALKVDATAFPAVISVVASSTTVAGTTANYWAVHLTSTFFNSLAKTVELSRAWLVRGPV